MKNKLSENTRTKRRKKRAYLTDQTLYFYNSSRRPESGFTWFKGSIVIKEDCGSGRNISFSKVKAYQPRLKEAVIDFANADTSNDKEIMRLIKKWGLLGLSNITSSSLKNRLARSYFKSGECSGDDYFSIFGIDKFSIGLFVGGVKDDAFFELYSEPLDLVRHALDYFQESAYTLAQISDVIKDKQDIWDANGAIYDTEELTELRWLNTDSGRINMTLAYLSNSKRPIWSTPVDSLYDAIMTCLVWTVKEQCPIKLCKNGDCSRFFWVVDNTNPYSKVRSRDKYCSDSCGQVMAKKIDNDRRWVERRYFKQKDAGVPAVQIVEDIIIEAGEKKRGITEGQIRKLINKIETGVSNRKIKR